MIRLIKHVAFAIAFAGMSCVGGWCLGAFIAQFAFEMPLWLYHAIRFAIQLSGHDELDNLDDIETLICMDRVKCQSAVSRSLTGQGRASARRSGPLTRRRFSMLSIGREGGACALTTMRDRLSDGRYQQGVWARTRRLSDG